jgi:hypothetical protein
MVASCGLGAGSATVAQRPGSVKARYGFALLTKKRAGADSLDNAA